MNRREFLIQAAALAAGAGVVGLPPIEAEAADEWPKVFRTTDPKKALVVWYGQTGHTRRMARLIGKVWEGEGLTVEVKDLRACDPASLADYDLLAAGCPVFYLDVPDNVQAWLRRVPPLRGAAAAAFNTYGDAGPNTAVRLLRGLAERGAVPVGVDAYQNMMSFPRAAGAVGSVERTLKARHLPNEATFNQARQFARTVVARVRGGQRVVPSLRWDFNELLREFPTQAVTKSQISTHRIDPARCIQCGLCVANCPVGTIALPPAPINRKACIVCMGCLNNCPADAVDIVFLHQKLQGFWAMLKQHGVVEKEPAEG
jgi:ferredoxin/flavodoxin